MEIGSLVIVIASIILSIYDFKKYRVPNTGILMLFVFVIVIKIYHKTDLLMPLLSGLIALIIFILINILTKGRLGLGDAKFTSIMAVHFGFLFWLEHLIYSSLFSLLIVTILSITGRIRRENPIPFIPFLTLGMVINLIVPVSSVLP